MAKYRVKKWGMMKRKLRPKKYVYGKGTPYTHWTSTNIPTYFMKAKRGPDPMADKKFVVTKKQRKPLPHKKPKRWGPRTIKRMAFLDHYHTAAFPGWSFRSG